MSSQNQQHPPPDPPGFWDFISGFGGQNGAPGQGVDHHGPSQFPPFFGGFPFGGGMHHGPPHPPHLSHHGHHGVPHPPPPPGSGVGHGPWDQEYGWGDLYHHGYEDDDSREARRDKRRERRECRRRDRHHLHCEDGTDEESLLSIGNKENEKDTDKENEKEKGASPDTRDADMPDPDEVAPEEGEYPPPPYGRDFSGPRGRGRGSFGRGAWHRGRGVHHGGRHCPRRGGPALDFSGMMHGFINHPFFRTIRDQAERYRSGATQSDGIDVFAPPVDIFNTERAFVVHVALPGAKKEDVGVDWNPDNNTLGISGVIHRPGDEEFIQGLVSGERRVGLFERNITLPPPGLAPENEDIDGFSITARMEDGVLIVTVPKTEKGWTEIRKVDIQ